MPGSIIKRSKDSWTVVVDLGRDPQTGKRRQLWRAVKGTKRDAQALVVQLLYERDHGVDLRPGRMTVGQYLEQWLEEFASASTAARTYERYRQIIRLHLIPALGAVPLTGLRPQHITAYYGRALKDGRLDGQPGGLTAQTVLHHHRVLREALHHAVRWQLLSRNPADAVQPPRPATREMQVLSPEGIQELLIRCSDPDLACATLVAVATGLRLGELLGLQWKDVVFESRTIQVVRALQYLSGQGLVISEPKTSRSRRQVHVPHEVVDALADHRRRQLERRLALGPAYDDHGLVSPEPDGRPTPPYKLSHRFAAVVKRAGVGPLRFHDLRHTSATLLLRAGVHPKVVSERLGHSGVAITLNTYSHVMPSLQEDAAERLGQYLPGHRSEAQRTKDLG